MWLLKGGLRVKWGMYDMRVCVAAKGWIEGEVGDV